MPVKLIRHAKIYAPENLGVNDILCVGKTIARIAPSIDPAPVAAVFGDELEVVEAEGCLCMPGIVDLHVHFNGAGGENRPEFRTPPTQLSELTRSGITTAIGLLGTDGISRSLKDLYMKARGLQNEGISTWMWTGSYQIPSPTITGSVLEDIALIDKVVGLKIAYSDHRSSHPDDALLVKTIASSRVGGINGAKSGKVMCHMGQPADGLERIRKAMASTAIPLNQVIPTHLNRAGEVLDAAIEHGKAGGNVDITSALSELFHFVGAVKPSKAVAKLLNAGVPVDRITMSSDGNGSMTVPLDGGGFKTIVAPVRSMFQEFAAFLKEGIPVTDAVRIVSTNPADFLLLGSKGRIKEGADADILLVGEADYSLKMVFAMGRKMVEDDVALVKGTFES